MSHSGSSAYVLIKDSLDVFPKRLFLRIPNSFCKASVSRLKTWPVWLVTTAMQYLLNGADELSQSPVQAASFPLALLQSRIRPRSCLKPKPLPFAFNRMSRRKGAGLSGAGLSVCCACRIGVGWQPVCGDSIQCLLLKLYAVICMKSYLRERFGPPFPSKGVPFPA